MCELCDNNVGVIIPPRAPVIRNVILDTIRQLGKFLDEMDSHDGLFSDNEAKLLKILSSFATQAKELSKTIDKNK